MNLNAVDTPIKRQRFFKLGGKVTGNTNYLLSATKLFKI